MKLLFSKLTIVALFSFSFAGCGGGEDCDPITPWINGNYSVASIEGIPPWKWFNNKLNTSGGDLFTSGYNVDIGVYGWKFVFEPNGKWYSSISGNASKGLFHHFNFYMSFSGSYFVTETTYELLIENIEKKVGPIDVSPIVEFMESQTVGSWSMSDLHWDLCHIFFCTKIIEFW